MMDVKTITQNKTKVLAGSTNDVVHGNLLV